MILKGVKVDCPVCGEKVVLTDMRCKNCGTAFHEIEEEDEDRAQEESQAIKTQMSEGPDADLLKVRAILANARAEQDETAEKAEKKKAPKPKKKKRLGLRRK